MLKKITAIILFYAVLLLGIPYCFCLLTPSASSKEDTLPVSDDFSLAVWSEFSPPETISSYITEKDEVIQTDLEEYIIGVVAAEMPASFEKEALKAQAVAARSYILNKIQTDTKHDNGAVVCNNPSHCKAYLTKDKLRENWGENFDEFYNKVSECVNATEKCVIIYDNKIANALFHSTSSGQTENAKDVWGGDVPYLVSVSSFGDELSPKYHSSVTLTIDEFKQKLKNAYPQINWQDGDMLIGDAQRSDAGGIIFINIANIRLSGSELRNIFSLRSTHIEFDITDSSVTLNVTGNGHGVGMSQYGANYLASQGKNYIEILKTYYTGVEVVKLS